jgi:hypothetical protein
MKRQVSDCCTYANAIGLSANTRGEVSETPMGETACKLSCLNA